MSSELVKAKRTALEACQRRARTTTNLSENPVITENRTNDSSVLFVSILTWKPRGCSGPLLRRRVGQPDAASAALGRIHLDELERTPPAAGVAGRVGPDGRCPGRLLAGA